MKFKTPTKKKAANTASLLAGATVGAMVSDAVASLIPVSNPTYARLAVMGLGVAGTVAVNGSDAVSEGTKGLFAGMAIQQGVKTSRQGLVKVLPESATANSFVQDALALNEAPVLVETAPIKTKDKFLGLPIQNRSKELYGGGLGNPEMNKTVSITPTSILA